MGRGEVGRGEAVAGGLMAGGSGRLIGWVEGQRGR